MASLTLHSAHAGGNTLWFLDAVFGANNGEANVEVTFRVSTPFSHGFKYVIRVNHITNILN